MLLWFATACATAAPIEQAPTDTAAAEPSFAFVDVRVLPMDDARVLEHHSVLVAGDRILAVGPVDELVLPEGLPRVDGGGRTLIPGLIDMHGHLLSDDRIADSYAAQELAVVLANGVTTLRNPIGKPAHLELRASLAAGEQLGPDLFVGSPQLAGRAFGREFHGHVVTTPEEARAAVRSAAERGYDFVKITFWIDSDSYDAITDEAARQGLRVVGHLGGSVPLERALAAGQQIEHLDGYLEALLSDAAPSRRSLSGVSIWSDEGWDNVPFLDEARLPALVAATLQAEVWNTPTLAFLHSSFGTGRSEAELDASPDARFVSPSVRADLLAGRVAFWSDPPPADARGRYVELRQRLVKALHDAGAPIMAGSDAPEWMLLPGFSLHRELEALVAAGLSEHAALTAATSTPARWLHGDFGVIAAGRRADLVLLDHDPLQDIASTREIAGVMKRGRWLPRAELDALLDDARVALANAPLLGK